ncbi:MAG: hypothetical protein FJ028_08560 [Chloroflexi bacterium]|nr:hypothetical protein [Chloroflexota bacterium]
MIRYIQDVLDGKRVLQPGEAAALAAAEAAFGDWPILKRYIEDVLASKRVLQPGEAAALRLDDAPALSGDEVRLSTLQPGEEFMFDGERWRVTRGRSNAGNVRVEKVSASGEPQGEWWREYSPDLVVTYAPSGEQLPFPWTDLPDVVPGAAILAPEPKRGWKQVAVPVLIRRDIYRDIEVGRKMPCPMCGRHEVRPFMYGLSPLEGTVNISHDDVRFGGCDIFSDSPSWGCKACGHEW